MLPNSDLVNFTQSLLNATKNKDSSGLNCQAFIDDFLYQAPHLLGIDNVGLWLYDAQINAFTCNADFLKSPPYSPEQPHQVINASNAPELFNWLHTSSFLHIESINTNTDVSHIKDDFIHHFSLQSALITPVFYQEKQQGFLIFGQCKHDTALTNEALLVATGLSQLFSHTLEVKAGALHTELTQTQELLAEVESVGQVGGWQYNIHTKELSWTKEVYKIYGLSPDEPITPESAIAFYSQNAQETISEAFNQAVSAFTPYELELPFINDKGRQKWVRTTGKIRSKNGAVTHVYGAFEDISQQKSLLETHETTEKNFQAIIENLYDCVIILDVKGKIKSANQVVEKTFGYSPYELVNKSISLLMPEPYASMHDKYMSGYMETGLAKIIGIGRELPAMRRDGSTFPIELSISEVVNGDVVTFIGIIKDISERKEAEKEIHQLAYFDEKTGLPNRYSFEKDLQNCFDKNRLIEDTFSIFQVNLDKFSQVNLTYGDHIGDCVLQKAAARLQETLPIWASAYRNNADSFYVIISPNIEKNKADTTYQTTTTIAELIISTIKKPMLIDHHTIKIHASIGILETSANLINFTDIKPLLELSLSKAKSKGGNGYVFAEAEETNALKRQSQISLAMMKDDFINELSLAIQPQYSANGKIIGSEALVRWNSSNLGFVPPDEFIQIAEKNGRIIKVGEWVLEKVCQIVSQKLSFSSDRTSVSVNISAKQIAQPNFEQFILACLEKYQIPHHMLLLELTETALVADLELVLAKMNNLKKHKLNFSIDDFGTGYSSLKYIKYLPISELKIDKSFVDDIQDDSAIIPIVNAIIQMAQSLNLSLVAEGVETKTQVNYLKSYGCETYQGYYFSKPISCEEWLQKWPKE